MIQRLNPNNTNKILSDRPNSIKARTSVAHKRAFVAEYLQRHPCVDCGETDVTVLQFDHKDGCDKRFNISSRMSAGYATLYKEIQKCDVRCANCHQRRTAIQQNWYDKNVLKFNNGFLDYDGLITLLEQGVDVADFTAEASRREDNLKFLEQQARLENARRKLGIADQIRDIPGWSRMTAQRLCDIMNNLGIPTRRGDGQWQAITVLQYLKDYGLYDEWKAGRRRT